MALPGGSRQGSQDATALLVSELGGRRDSGGGEQGRTTFTALLQSWVSRKFAAGLAMLFPVVVTVYITWWFFSFFDSIFSPIYYSLFQFHVFGLGFITSMGFILGTGVFFSSWLGTALLDLGELIIHRLPLIKHIYSASKQISAALNPENESAKAFQECVLIRHPRQGEYAFAFITGKTVLQVGTQDLHLHSVYVPTNHAYLGDVFLLEEKDIIRTNLTVQEGLEVVLSVGMALPKSVRAAAAQAGAAGSGALQQQLLGSSILSPKERSRH